MNLLARKRSKKTGMLPGAMVSVSRQRVAPTGFTVFEYDEESLVENKLNTVEETLSYASSSKTVWIDVDGIHDSKPVESLGRCFNIHPLILEDILNTEKRPKIEDCGTYINVIVKMLYLKPGSKEIVSEQISFVVGPGYLLSFQEQGGDIFDAVRARLREKRGKLRSQGPDALLCALLDTIVDHYFIVLETVGEEIEALETRLLLQNNQTSMESIYRYKRILLFMRRAVWPLREVVGALARGNTRVIGEQHALYFRDILDHIIEVMDIIETLRDILTELVNINLSQTSNKLNGVMKILTMIATIFMPLSFLAALYGMNFKYMPELEVWWAYPTLLGFMFLIAAAMLTFFRKKRWI